MKKIIWLALAILGVVYLVLGYYFSSLVITAPRRDDAEVRKLMQVRAGVDIDTFRQKLPVPEDFTTASSYDDIELAGWYFAQDTSRCAVVIAHGYGSTRLSMMKYAPIFWDCGCDLIVYDHRGHGASGGTKATGGNLESEDLLSVTAWLQARSGLGLSQIGWMGESWGGATVLMAGARDENVAFIIAESAFEDWETAVFERAQRQYGQWIGLLQPGVWAWASLRTGTNAWQASALSSAPQIAEPVLVLHSQADAETAAEQSVHIAAALPAAHREFHNLEWGAMHGGNVFARPAAYRQILLDFIAEFAPDWGGECE